ncbi:unnamed protein product [Pleuronectes platessa]|uniref:Uncharacterized protein n=1 Tax=Pleuronectes platessa TaxID=8262 RepID=A0A9N7ZA19_PLEPL|nr:unnamed protein product [Pleuronectes platessa]
MHSAASLLSPHPPSLCRENEIMRTGSGEGLRGARQTEREAALECSGNQGLCAQEGPINPAVCLYISSGTLKTAKKMSRRGPGGVQGGPLREGELLCKNSAEDTTALEV